MVKRNNHKSGFTAIAAIVIFFGLYFTLSAGNTQFSATMKDGQGRILAEDSVEVAIGYDSAQSLFGLTGQKDYFYLQSTMPADKQKETVVQLRAVVENPMQNPAYLKFVNVYKNRNGMYSENFPMTFLKPNEQYIYKTVEIDLEGLDAQLNTIRLEFIFEDLNGNNAIQNFEYRYFSLTPCISDTNCKGINSKCDVENLARFSTTKETYCVKPCTAHAHCYEGQVCIQGRCGY